MSISVKRSDTFVLGGEIPDGWGDDAWDIDRWENDGGRSLNTRHGSVRK
ncbi:hypothetical protein [Lysinibacillus fusiformis]